MFPRPGNGLVDRAGDFVAAKGSDHPLDLPPVAEARDIADVAAALGAHRRLEAGVVAITLDQLSRIVEGEAAVDERDTIHTAHHYRRGVSRLRTIVVNKPLAIFGLA